ncbi:MAG: VIT1/CCC1 transporter family protein [Candidatus Gracilibacteria bacterium]
MTLTPQLLSAVSRAQRNEITEFHVYSRLAKIEKNSENKKILQKIANDEHRHHDFWQKFTGKPAAPHRLIAFFYTLSARLFGLVFSLRLMERGEDLSQKNYETLKSIAPEVKNIIEDEEAHEHALIDMIKSSHLEYTGSIVLGLNDALVELTGALAGLTLALRDTHLIAVVGLITGLAASMSMAASEYLSSKEEGHKNALKASVYTGLAYVGTVIILITPYFTLENPFAALAITLGLGIFVILIFTFYSSVANKTSFKRKFLEMALLSLSIAAINFLIGYLVKKYIADF